MMVIRKALNLFIKLLFSPELAQHENLNTCMQKSANIFIHRIHLFFFCFLTYNLIESTLYFPFFFFQVEILGFLVRPTISSKSIYYFHHNSQVYLSFRMFGRQVFFFSFAEVGNKLLIQLREKDEKQHVVYNVKTREKSSKIYKSQE